MSGSVAIAVMMAFGGGVAAARWLRRGDASAQSDAAATPPAPTASDEHEDSAETVEGPAPPELPELPSWVASVESQLTAPTADESAVKHSLGDPLPATMQDTDAPEPDHALEARCLAVLAECRETAILIRRHFAGMDGVDVTILDDAAALEQATTDGLDVLLVAPERAAEIPAHVVCPVVPIRPTTRRGRLLEDVAAAIAHTDPPAAAREPESASAET